MAKLIRRQYFIDKRLQTKYALLTILLLVVYTLSFAVILFTPYIFELSTGSTLEEKSEAARILLNLHNSVWPALGLVILILSVVSIFVTHKIAGPVYRFRKVLAEVSGGNLDISINLRRRDDLKDLADDLNTLIDELRITVTSLQDDSKTMSACISELEEQIKTNEINSEAGSKLIARLKDNQVRTAEIVRKYSK